MESSFFRRNISFAAVVIMATVVNVVITTNKVNWVAPIAEANQYLLASITDLMSKASTLATSLPISNEVKEVPFVQKTDLQCMAENIYFEAATQSYAGKLAVGQVVLNRLKSADRPDSVCGVIYEGKMNSRTAICQFSWVCEAKKKIDQTSDAWAKSLAAARTLLDKSANIIDLTEGSQYYHADYVNPAWAKTLKFVVKIDNHLFYAPKR